MMRYSRQVILPQIGDAGQERICGSSVAIIGLGALGSVSAELLARAGVGKIVLIDYDIVQLSNLQRQSLYEEADVGVAKVHAAKRHLERINQDIEVVALLKQFNSTSAQLLLDVDLVLDCTDNMYSRFLINEYCKKERKVWIYCAAVEMKGAVAVFDEEVCFNCVFGGRKGEHTCDDSGILGAASHMAASLQCALALRYLVCDDYEHELIQFCVWPVDVLGVKIKRREGCSVCQGEYPLLSGKGYVDYCITKRCVKIRPSEERDVDISSYNTEELDGTRKLIVDGVEVLLHDEGAMEIKTTDLDLAKKIAKKIWK